MNSVNVIYFFVVTAVLSAVHGAEDNCVSSLGTNVRGRNKMKNANLPLVKLYFTDHTIHSGHIGHEEYKVHVSSKTALDSVKILAMTDDDCGTGSFLFQSKDFNLSKVDNCPLVLSSTLQVPVTELPSLIWRPPFCGCVQFKAVVVNDNDIYFQDDNFVKNGPLSQTVCVQKRMSRNHYLEAMCNTTARTAALDYSTNQNFLSRHHLDISNKDEILGVQWELEFRRIHNRQCCKKKRLEDRNECMNDNRRNRVDKICAHSYLDVPFASFRDHHMRHIKKKCCTRIGEERYWCFGNHSEITPNINATFLDFSMDDTDPANDVVIFTTVEDTEIVNLLRTAKFDNNSGTSNEQLETASKEQTDEEESESRTSRPNGNSQTSEKADKSRASGERRRPTTDLATSQERKALRNKGSSEKKTPDYNPSPKHQQLRSSSERKSAVLPKAEFNERKGQGRSSVEKKGGSQSEERGYERDYFQGGSSAERTLRKIKLQMEKLELKKACCEAGELAGTSVISRSSVGAKIECKLSANKHIQSNILFSGSKICSNSFIACCEETSISIKMSSSEFQESPYVNAEEDDDPEVENVPSDQKTEGDAPQVDPAADLPNSATPPAVLNVSDDKVHIAQEEVDDEDENEELTGPQKFDAVDNQELLEADSYKQSRGVKSEDYLDVFEESIREEENEDLEDDPLLQEQTSASSTKKKLNVRKIFKADLTNHQARKQAKARKPQLLSSKNGGRSKQAKTTRERIASRTRSSSSERYQPGQTRAEQRQVKVQALDSGEMVDLRKKSRTMDSREMSAPGALFRNDGGYRLTDGGQSRKSRRHVG